MPLGKYIDVSIWHWLKDEILEKPYSKHRTLQNIISMYAIKNRYSSLCIITQTFFISQFLVNFIKNLGEIHIYDYHQVDKHLALNLSSTRDSVCFVTVSYMYISKPLIWKSERTKGQELRNVVIFCTILIISSLVSKIIHKSIRAVYL